MLKGRPPGAGRSSFDQIDQAILFPALRLTPSTVFVDLGCGKGDYVMSVAERVGAGGKIYGVDAWQPAIDELSQRIEDIGLTNVRPILADVTDKVPLPDHMADVCLMAHVLHDFKREGGAEGALREASRILKTTGILAIVEPKKVEAPYGPSLRIRLAPEEVEELLAPFGFMKDRLLDIAEFEYMIVASRAH